MAGMRSLVVVWLILMSLLAATVAGSFLATGASSAVLSLGIAACKATLVFWFFMNLRSETGLVRLAAIGAGAWLLLLILLSATDYAVRGAG